MSLYEAADLVFHAVEAVAVALGFWLAYRQLRLLQAESARAVELTKRSNAMALIARYNDPAFTDRCRRLREDAALQANHRECGYLLNLFEEIAIAIRHHTANEALLEDFYGTVLRRWLEKDYMVAAMTHARAADPATYHHVIDLYRRWEVQRGSRLRIAALPELDQLPSPHG